MSIKISITAIIFMIITLVSLFLILLSVIYYYKYRKLNFIDFIDKGNRSKYFLRIVSPSCIFSIYSSNIFSWLIYSKIEPSVFLYLVSLYTAVCCFLLFCENIESIETKDEYYIPPIDKFLDIGITFVIFYGLLWLLSVMIKIIKIINFPLF